MRSSLGLSLYSLATRRASAPIPAWPDRPRGALIWLHSPGSGATRPLLELARRLVEDDGHPVLLTCPTAPPPQRGVIHVPPPPGTAAAARAFLDHWQPAAAILSEGELRPALVLEAAQREIPIVVVDGRAPRTVERRRGWWPGLTRGLLGKLTAVIAIDENAARIFRRAGVPASRVRADGRMEEGSRAMTCNEAERAALVRLFRTRPVWLAASLPEVEEAAILAAHRAALRLAHRLLLIIVPESPARADVLAHRIGETEGWTVARRSADEEPDEETEVFLADSASEFGLWYRLAPITFMGGSLYGTGSLRDPFEPAALGSAILHGPNPGQWAGAYSRLADAHAARLVASSGDLSDALGDLLSPDRAARLAQGAWAVASAGAEVTDRVILMIRELMEARS